MSVYFESMFKNTVVLSIKNKIVLERMGMYGKVTNCWITLNRACNLKCEWCYAKDASNRTMQFEDVTKVLDFLKQIDVHSVTLIGGEPTVYPEIFEVIKKARNNGIRVGMVTNGVKLVNKKFLDELIDSGISSISVSLKGYDKESFIETAKCDAFEDVLQGIRNLSDNSVPYSVSFVLTEKNIPFISKGIDSIVQCGAKSIGLAFCYNFESCRSNQPGIVNPYLFSQIFMDNYEEINTASNGRFSLHQTLPLCVWPIEFIEKLNERRQIRSICQLLNKNGLIFDTDLSVIPCNAMYDYKFGKYGVDFEDAITFDKFWNSEKVQQIYDKLRALPDHECAICERYVNCGGGCVSNWFNYSFGELKRMKGGE